MIVDGTRQALDSRKLGSGGVLQDEQREPSAADDAPPFELLIRHERDGGTYRLGLEVRCRAEAVEQLLCRHRLCAWNLFVDVDSEREIEQAQQRLRDEKTQAFRERPLSYFMSAEYLWCSAKQIYHAHRHSNVYRISVGDLLEGTWASGTLDEMRMLEQIILSKVDLLAASITAGGEFDDQIVSIFAPGTRRPDPVDGGGTPPDGWRS